MTQLQAGRDIHIIGSLIDVPADNRRIFILRWASRPDQGFPRSGYRITRMAAGSTSPKEQRPVGPAFVLPRTDSWESFVADAEARRPEKSPYFDSFVERDWKPLLDLIRIADPAVDFAERAGLVPALSGFFGAIHEKDPRMAWMHWRQGPVPSLDRLLADPSVTADLEDFYRQRSVAYLLGLGLRIEYALLLGLATEDSLPPGGDAVDYGVWAEWDGSQGESRTETTLTNRHYLPSPPNAVSAEIVPTTLLHPEIPAMMESWPLPAERLPTDAAGRPVPEESLFPRVPSSTVGLSWSPAARSSTQLLDHEGLLYEISRFDHGEGSASLPAPPPVPAGAAFTVLGGGELMLRPASAPHFIDMTERVWPGLEGYLRYRVRAVNILGQRSEAFTEAVALVRDTLAPPSPPTRLLAGSPVTASRGARSAIRLRVDWGIGEALAAPDLAEFRASVKWVPLERIQVAVLSVDAVRDSQADLTVESLDVPPGALEGLLLSLPEGDFPVVGHSAGARARLTLQRPSDLVPTAPSIGVIVSQDPAKQAEARVARLPAGPLRRTAVAETRDAPPAFRFESAPSVSHGKFYIHGLGRAVELAAGSDGFWSAVGADAPSGLGWLRGSPVLYCEPMDWTIELAVPAGFGEGVARVHVAAADDRTYAPSPPIPSPDPALSGLKGNESLPSEIVVSALSGDPLPGPGVPEWRDGQILWARSAAQYSESADFELSWSGVPEAHHYEVWRVLEGALPGAAVGASDRELRALAEGQAMGAFELRSSSVFGTRYVDSLPGRAPTRALYFVRAVPASGSAGARSALIGPVRVPDVRCPAMPNLVKAAAAPASDGDRAVRLEWTQPGSPEGLVFEIYSGESPSAEPSWVARLDPVAASGEAGRFRALVAGVKPWKTAWYRVVATRVAPDPADPSGVATREIRGPASRALPAFSIRREPLAAPASAVARAGEGGVRLRWLNPDEYSGIEIRRRRTGQGRYLPIAQLPGDAVEYFDAGLTSGDWQYSIVGRDPRRAAANEPAAEVYLP